MVDLIDHSVGRILQVLEEEGLSEETLISFTSDHGELGDHGLWFKGPFFYEGLVNIPLIITGPKVPKGGVCHSLFSTVDILPTILEALGITIPSDMDGLSQWPVIREPHRRVRDSCLVEYRNGYGGRDVASATLVRRDWKYTYYESGDEELTDLLADPAERQNVASCPEYRSSRDLARLQLLRTLLATECDFPEQIAHA